MILKNCRIFDGENFISENVIVLKEDKIVKITFEKDLGEELMNDEVIDIQGNIISPGFIDLQLNGCGGVLFNDDISLETLKTMNETNKKYGCTSFLPTLITSPDEKIENALKLMKSLHNREEFGVLGLHIEGPYISVGKKGIHRPEYIRVLSDKIINEISEAGKDIVKIITIAPENAHINHLKRIQKAGINISIGHTDATYDQCNEKKEYFNHATHLYNAMRGLESREPGVLGFILDSSNIYCGIIPDGLHVHYSSISIAKKLLGDKLYMVTDAASPAGTNMTEFMFEGNLVYHKDGKCVDANGTLGGSALVMIDGVKNLIQGAKFSYEEALKMATSYPAKAVQVDSRYGHIKPGYIADLTYFDENFKVKGTISKGILERY